jgi:dGTP triphosphohydrolase
MDEEIDTRVTPALHPINVRELDGYDDDTASILGPAETAFSEAYMGIAQVHTAREKALSNETWTEAQALLQTADFSDKVFEKVAKRFDAVTKTLNTIVEGIETELNAPIEVKAAHTLASEIRGYARSLPTGERMTFVQQAITDGDRRTAESILGAPPFLSGMTTEMHAVLTRMFHAKHNPLKEKRLKAARAGLELIEKRQGLVFSELEKAIGANPRKIAAIRASRTAAEAALLLREA